MRGTHPTERPEGDRILDSNDKGEEKSLNALLRDLMDRRGVESLAVQKDDKVGVMVAKRLAEGAAQGVDFRFIKEVYNRLEGRPGSSEPKDGGINARDAQELRLNEAEERIRVYRTAQGAGNP